MQPFHHGVTAFWGSSSDNKPKCPRCGTSEHVEVHELLTGRIRCYCKKCGYGFDPR